MMNIQTAPARRYRPSAIAAASHQTTSNNNYQWTDPIKVSTYNTAGYHVPFKTIDDVAKLSRDADIFGLQEVYPIQMFSIKNSLSGNHKPYVGSAYWGGSNGEYSPIFYNKHRFEAVHGETVRLHDQNYNGIQGPPRIANFLVLKEKKTGAVMLVVNTHWANGNPEARKRALSVIDQKLTSLSKKYPLDNITVMGDFNSDVASMHGGTVKPASYDPQGLPTYETKKSNIDGILTNAEKASSMYNVTDGGESDHNIVSRNIVFKY
jgi:endonuclease/exonuclease/phosphatase family metal-dependent hydrolase